MSCAADEAGTSAGDGEPSGGNRGGRTGDGAGPVSGMLLIDKQFRLSSMSILRVVKRRLINAGLPKGIKVGHAGTLDPLATGLLIVLVGREATRLSGDLMGDEKEYTAEIDLLTSSTTDDMEGELVRINPAGVENDGAGPTREKVEGLLREKFTGVVQQAPPAHSAVWVDGKRAYRLARKGQLTELPTRPVRIDEIVVKEYTFPRLVIDVRCGKGTYIRSMARDIGAALGLAGTLTGLRRTRVGVYRVDDALGLDDVADPLWPGLLMRVPEARKG